MSRLPFTLKSLNKIIDAGIYSDLHNIIILWGELGKGKTTLEMTVLYRIYKDWKKVLSFELEPHVCQKCGHEFKSSTPYVYEIPCESCNEETKTTDLDAAITGVYKKKLVIPFPFDYKTGFTKSFPKGQVFSINTGKARGRITQIYPYQNFTFAEFRSSLETAVELHLRYPAVGWDDIAVYFHRSNIQYMHPDVKNFFSRYNFVRKYIGNVIITVPSLNFVPIQLMPFCTADVWVTERGAGDFDTKREMRSFWGKTQTWTKSYDGRAVAWDAIDKDVFDAYEQIRHAHAVEAFEKPEEILVTSMPKKEEFSERESLF